MSEYFFNRRTIRRYTDGDISDQLLDSILRRAAKAPTCGNMQLYSVIVTRSEEMLQKIAPLHFNQPAATGAKVILTICADFNRFTRWCKLNNADAGFDNFLSFTSAYSDATILAQQIVTIAEQEGLGTCYLGTVTYNAKEISDLLELPEMVVPVACVSLGWPAEEGEETDRLATEAFVHNERYRRDSDDEILRLYRPKEDFPPNAGYAAQNCKDNLAQVFAEVRYPRAANEAFSAKFIELLKQKKFLTFVNK